MVAKFQEFADIAGIFSEFPKVLYLPYWQLKTNFVCLLGFSDR